MAWQVWSLVVGPEGGALSPGSALRAAARTLALKLKERLI